MIASLQGRLERKTSSYLVVDVSGVGYRVFVSRRVLESIGPLGERVQLLIHTRVKEDAFHLYGFLDDAEQEAFEALISMNGIGPRLAIGVLSGIDARELALAVCGADTARLCLIPGIGKKKAERMIIDLKDRLLPLAQSTGDGDISAASTMGDLRSALSNLDFKVVEIEQVLGCLRERVVTGEALDTLLPEALRLLR
ncbi:MAG TPA: Holliday junction branch migration protein RuvA [Myxococcota bacterium]|nr:Holliday junction branch migration protein RuvA [Myxococcota bacterium]